MYDLDPFEKEMAAFANRVDIIVALMMGKKLSSRDAYKEIKSIMKNLKASAKKLKEENKTYEQG
jgi:hypothetical protein